MTKILITNTTNGIINKEFNYLIGFQPSLGGIIIGKKYIKIFLDSRYFFKSKYISHKKLLKKIGTKKEIIFIKYCNNLINELCKNIGNNKKIILEDNIPIKLFKKIKSKLKNEISIKKPFFEEKRKIKKLSEIKNIKKAIKIIEKVFLSVQKLNKSGKLIGKTELELRSFIITKIFEFGGEGESFETIVAHGKNSAIPHHKTGDTIIGNGPLLIDMGALYKGYCSDFSRTIWVGKINDLGAPGGYDYKKFIKIYDITKKAYKKAFLSIKTGKKLKNIDEIARNYIENKGYGEYFTHGLGHGVGLNIHEKPGVNQRSNEFIKKGMVFTIEPGIYLEGKFGVRFENIVFV